MTDSPRSKKRRTATSSSLNASTPSAQSSLTQLSPAGDLFAFLSLALDKHRLRVYDTNTWQAVAQYTLEEGRATALRWLQLAAERQPERSDSANSDTVIALGLSTGSIVIFSPSHGRVMRVLSNPSSTSPINSISSSSPSSIWTASSDNTIRSWSSTSLTGTWTNPSAYTSIALRPQKPDGSETEVHLIAAHHSIYHLVLSPSSSTPRVVSTYTGHASSISSLQWQASSSPTRFASIALQDRFVHLWDTSSTQLVASIPMDADVRQIAFSPALLLAVSFPGTMALFALPSANLSSSSAPVTLSPQTTISWRSAQITEGTFAQEREGVVKVAGLVGGTQPVFDTVTYLDPLQKHIPLITLSPPSSSLLSQSSSSVVQNPTRTKRYTESDNLHLQTGHQQQPESMETDQVNDGELDVENDLAEISLGERLRIREEEMNGANGTIPRPGGDSSSASSARESDDEDPKNASTSHNLKKTNPLTLTRLLAQSLHTSDTALLSSILTPLHSETIVLETVKRLQPQLALSLLGACVERIGKGGRAAGRWIRAVLVVHAGYLMSIPDLSYRLSTLHTTLQTRLALHPKLLSLNGRLDLLLTQIEMNSSNGPASIATGQGKAKKDKTAPVTKYVEGESSEGDEVEAEEAEEEGSVEDVQLGGSGDEDDSEEDEDEEAEGGEGENWIDDEAMEGEESWEGASESEGSEEDSEEE